MSFPIKVSQSPGLRNLLSGSADLNTVQGACEQRQQKGAVDVGAKVVVILLVFFR